MLLKVIFGECISLKSNALILESLGSVTEAEHEENPQLIQIRLISLREMVGSSYDRLGVVDIEIDEAEVLKRLPFVDPAPLKGKVL